MKTQSLQYEFDGVIMTGFLADGSEGKRAPAVIVSHEAMGINDHVRDRARLLADLGYVAFAIDLYGVEGLPRDEAFAKHIELMSTPGLMLNRASAALNRLLEHDNVDPERLAAIGFCQGGITSLELVRAGAPIKAAIGFHPGLKRPAGSREEPIFAKVLMMVGAIDPEVPVEDREAFVEEMDRKGADWQLHLFGGVGHVYTNPDVDALGIPGYAYSSSADRRSWTMAIDLLKEALLSDCTKDCEPGPAPG